MDEHELAWAAGFFDGDGWAALVRDRRRGAEPYRPRAQINQSSPGGVPSALLRFRTAIGRGTIGGPVRKPARRDLYWWICSGRDDVFSVGSLIAPWLSCVKRAQFRAAAGLVAGAEPRPSLAWAAGLFDAEGSTSLSDHRSHPGRKYVEAAITQGGEGAPPDVLVRFKSAVGAGLIYGPYAQRGATQPVYRWRLHLAEDVRRVIADLDPWLDQVKRRQAADAFLVIDAQSRLPRGRVEWGSHKTYCIHGHAYATARVRPYRSRGVGIERRDSKQCLECTREQARAKRLGARTTISDLAAAGRDPLSNDATC